MSKRCMSKKYYFAIVTLLFSFPVLLGMKKNKVHPKKHNPDTVIYIQDHYNHNEQDIPETIVDIVKDIELKEKPTNNKTMEDFISQDILHLNSSKKRELFKNLLARNDNFSKETHELGEYLAKKSAQKKIEEEIKINKKIIKIQEMLEPTIAAAYRKTESKYKKLCAENKEIDFCMEPLFCCCVEEENRDDDAWIVTFCYSLSYSVAMTPVLLSVMFWLLYIYR